MKYTGAILLVSLQILFGVNALPTTGESLAPKAGPIRLDPGKEYSPSELKQLFAARAAGDLDHLQEQDTDTTLDVKDTGVDVTETSFGDAKQTVWNLNQSADLTFSSLCPRRGNTDKTFFVRVNYNGKKVQFTRGINIDAWGPTSVAPIVRWQPIKSDAQFHHYECMALNDNTVCSYWFHGTVKAAVRYWGDEQGIEIGAFQQDERSNKAPFISENCSSTPGRDGKISCPPPNGKHCAFNGVVVAPGHSW